MERINGYLCIDDCEKKLADKDKGQYWVYIDGVEYYFKPARFSYNELIAYYGAKILEIDACFYDLAILNGELGYISKSLRSEGVRLVSGDEIFGDYINHIVESGSMNLFSEMFLNGKKANAIDKDFCYEDDEIEVDDINNLQVIWQALMYRYKNKIDINKVMDQFVLMYIFVVIFNDMDKHPGNWFILESEKEIKLAPLFDNELIFDNYYRNMNFSVSFQDYQGGVFNSLRVFLCAFPSEYFELFVNKFEKIELNFEMILALVEKQIGVGIPKFERNCIIAMFDKHSECIRKIIDEFNVKRIGNKYFFNK